MSRRGNRILSGVGGSKDFDARKACETILAPHSKLAFGARGSDVVLTFHCYFLTNKDN